MRTTKAWPKGRRTAQISRQVDGLYTTGVLCNTYHWYYIKVQPKLTLNKTNHRVLSLLLCTVLKSVSSSNYYLYILTVSLSWPYYHCLSLVTQNKCLYNYKCSPCTNVQHLWCDSRGVMLLLSFPRWATLECSTNQCTFLIPLYFVIMPYDKYWL